MEQRFQRNTWLVIVVLLTAGWFWSGWWMALGVALGGALSLFNKRWLTSSVRALLSHEIVVQSGQMPPFASAKLILRYFIIALVIAGAMWTESFDPIGIGLGFAAFVFGVMIEAGYQLYLSFKTNETTSEE